MTRGSIIRVHTWLGCGVSFPSLHSCSSFSFPLFRRLSCRARRSWASQSWAERDDEARRGEQRLLDQLQLHPQATEHRCRSTQRTRGATHAHVHTRARHRHSPRISSVTMSSSKQLLATKAKAGRSLLQVGGGGGSSSSTSASRTTTKSTVTAKAKSTPAKAKKPPKEEDEEDEEEEEPEEEEEESKSHRSGQCFARLTCTAQMSCHFCLPRRVDCIALHSSTPHCCVRACVPVLQVTMARKRPQSRHRRSR